MFCICPICVPGGGSRLLQLTQARRVGHPGGVDKQRNFTEKLLALQVLLCIQYIRLLQPVMARHGTQVAIVLLDMDGAAREAARSRPDCNIWRMVASNRLEESRGR